MKPLFTLEIALNNQDGCDLILSFACVILSKRFMRIKRLDLVTTYLFHYHR